MPTRYVFGTGSTGLAPTVNLPDTLHNTIAAAVSAASIGDIIEVSAGVYDEVVNVTKSLTINGAKKDVAAFSTGGAPRSAYGVTSGESVIQRSVNTSQFCFTVSASNVTINGFKCVINNAVRDAFNVRLPVNADANADAVERSNITIINNVIENTTTSSQRQFFVMGESDTNAQQAGKGKLSNVKFNNNYVDFNTTCHAAVRGGMMNSQYIEMTYQDLEVNNNYLKFGATFGSRAIGSFAANSSKPIWYNSVKIKDNTLVGAAGNTGSSVSGMFDMNSSCVISGNTSTMSRFCWINFREAGGQIINNTIVGTKTDGTCIQLADAQYGWVPTPVIPTISGNTLSGLGSGGKWISLDDRGSATISSIMNANTISSSKYALELASNNTFTKALTIYTGVLASYSSYVGTYSPLRAIVYSDITSYTAALPTDLTTAQKSDVQNSLTSAVGSAVNQSGSNTIKDQLNVAKSAAASAEGSGVANASNTTFLEAVKAVNALASPADAKTAVADVYSNQSVTVSPSQGADLIKGLPDEKKPSPDELAKLLAEFSGWNVSVPTPPAIGQIGKINLPSSADSTLYYFPALGLDKEYEFLLGAETATPDGETPVYVKYTSSGTQIKTGTSGTYSLVSPSSPITLTRLGSNYVYNVLITGSLGVYTGAIPCFPAGQRVMTPAGWRAVETLRDGDKVVTETGSVVPAKIYSSSVITTAASAPITIAAHAFGRNAPAAPVRLSPRHAVRMDANTWQFPCNLLRMGARGVTQDAPGAKVQYYHIALPNYLRDNLVLEGGVVAESYGAPFVKIHGLNPSKIYTFNKGLGAFERMSPAAVATKTKSA